MVVTLTKKQVNEIVKSLGQVMPRKKKVPVLGFVLFEPGEDGCLQVTATDLGQTLTKRVVPDKLEGASARFLFPMAELRTLGKSMPRGGTVTLQPVSDGSVTCTMEANGQPVSRTVATMPTEEFPEVAVSAELVECDVGAFLRAYREAAFAAHSDPGRLVLHAVFADQEKQVLVGTDGQRLTRHPLPKFPLPSNAILPLNKVLLKHFPEADEGRIGLHEKNEIQTLVLATDELTYSCRCPEGTFPNYEQVVPDMGGFATTLHFGSTDLEVIKPLLPFLNEHLQYGLFFTARADGVTIGISDEDDGKTAVVLPECRLEGEDIDVAANGKMLAEALGHGFLTMRICDGYTPLAFDNGRGALHLLMPLKPDEAADTQPEPTAQTPTQPTPPEDNPMPGAETATPEAEKPGAATPPTTVPERNLEMIEAQDPVARLEELVAESQESIKQANASVRELKKQIRAVKTHYREREKQVGAREKEMEKSLALIQRLQETIAA